jgi:Na+/melibiose symporter-like transporter
MFLRVSAIFSVFRTAFSNPILRRLVLAYLLFGSAEFGVWITLLVFAYDHGRSTASMLMVLVQLIPTIAISPFIGAFVDRNRPSRVLFFGFGLQAVSMGAVAVAIGLHVPTFVVFVLAPFTSISLSMSRSPQAALLPAIVRTPDELTAANVMSGWMDGAAALIGPGVAGILLAWRGPWLAVAVTAAMALVSMLLVANVAGPAAAVIAEDEIDDSGDRAEEGDNSHRRMSGLKRALASLKDGARSNIEGTIQNPQIRVLLTLHTFYFALIGSLDLLCVILALDFLHMGAGGAGYLNAALGAGALLAGFLTAFLVGRRHLSRTLAIALLVAVFALALIDFVHGDTAAFFFIGIVGLAGAVFDVTARTLLQRSAPSDAIGGAFAILETLMDLGLALGVVLVRLALAIGGVRAALLAPAVIAIVLIAALWRQLQKIDSSATVPQVEIQLLRSIPLFAALPAPSIEGLARELVAVHVPAGTRVITEGDSGDRYYAVADGSLEFSRGKSQVGTVARGQGFGEIALVRDVPRQASVTAITDSLLYSLEKDPFVQTVMGHVTASSRAKTVIAKHLGEGDN